MASNYRRVPSAETEDVSSQNRRSLSERFIDKLFALAWVVVAAIVARVTRFFNVILHSPDANRTLLNIVFLMFGINTVLVLYLTVYLPKCKGLTDSSAWPVYCPRVVPTMTVIGVIASLLLIRATWPVWGFLAPLILGVEGMGFLFALHFVPWF